MERREDMLVALGRVLRAARMRRHLTLDALATSSGGRFGASAIGAYERGDRAISLPGFCDLASYLGVEPTELLGEVLALYRGHQGFLEVTASTGEDFVTVRTGERDTPIKAQSAKRRSAEPR